MNHERQKSRQSELLKFMPEALKRIRQSAGIRQTDVAELSGLTKAMLSAYETGKALPSLQSLTAFLAAIGRDFSDLQEELDIVRKVSPKRTPADKDLEREVGHVVLKAIKDAIGMQQEGGSGGA